MPSPLTIDPNKGVRLQLTSYFRIRTGHGGGDMWEHQHQVVLRQNLGDYLPKAIPEGRDSVLFQHYVGGVEVCSLSQPITQGKAVPRNQLDGLQKAVAALKQKASDPHCDPNVRKVIESFRVPDPVKDPELYRIHGTGKNARLLVFWGVEKDPDTAIAPEEAVLRIPSQNENSSKRSWLAPVGMLGLIAVLGVAAWWFLGRNHQGTDAESSPLIAGSQTPNEGERLTGGNGSSSGATVPTSGGTSQGGEKGGSASQVSSGKGDHSSPKDGAVTTDGKSPLNENEGSSVGPKQAGRDPSHNKGAGTEATQVSPLDVRPPSQDDNVRTKQDMKSTGLTGVSPTVVKPIDPSSPPVKPDAPSAPDPGVGSDPRVTNPKKSNTVTDATSGKPPSVALVTPVKPMDNSSGTTSTLNNTLPVPVLPAKQTGISGVDVPAPPPAAPTLTGEVVQGKAGNVLGDGKVQTFLSLRAKDEKGQVVSIAKISSWKLDGQIQKDSSGKVDTSNSITVHLAKGKHNVEVIGSTDDDRPVGAQAVIDVGIEIRQEPDIKLQQVTPGATKGN